MTKKLAQFKKDYYHYLDRKARHIAYKLSKRKPVTKLILDYIKELYTCEKIDSFDSKRFKSAYHNPISSDLEFLVARILYHYSGFKKSGWKIYLRSQVGKTAPDVRLDLNGKTFAIVEIKAKAGWIQPFFSKESFKKSKKRLKAGKSDFDPSDLIKNTRGQLKKYYKTFKIKPKQVFVFLPSLALVHRKRSMQKIKDYEKWFVKTSKMSRECFVLLSNNLNLNLSSGPKRKEYQPTDKFETFISLLNKFAKRYV